MEISAVIASLVKDICRESVEAASASDKKNVGPNHIELAIFRNRELNDLWCER